MRIPGRVLLFIPREAVGYSVELFGLSVFPSVRPSVRLSSPLEGSITLRLRPHLSPHNDDSYIFGMPKWSRCAELASKSTLYGSVMLTKGSIALRLRANYSAHSNDLYIFGKANRPRCASKCAKVKGHEKCQHGSLVDKLTHVQFSEHTPVQFMRVPFFSQ